MQLIDSPQTPIKIGIDSKLEKVLEDIVHNLEIHDNFCIQHPAYQSLELPTEIVERLRTMPEQMQQKYLSLQLRSFLYGIYYNGYMRSSLALNGEQNNLPLDLENNTFLGVDVNFYEQLNQSNCGTGYFDHGWSILKEEADGSLVVSKGGLKLHIQRDRHLSDHQQTAVIGDIVAIKMPKNLVQNGFYMAVGNLGLHHHDYLTVQPVLVRVYFNVTPEGAIGVMSSLTKQLNEQAIPFSFKVLYNPKDYKRHDSGVLYFERRDYDIVKQVLPIIYQENAAHFQPEIPLFTKQIAPGLGLAEEPNQKFASQESFGMNRCQIIANALLTAWYQGDNSPQGRMQAIVEEFSKLRIDLQRTYLNADSEDIYTVI